MRFAVVVQLFIVCFVLFISGCGRQKEKLHQRVIVVDAGHGGTAGFDEYRVGPTGEREEWINLRVALELERLLLEAGAKVIMTRTDDRQIDLTSRAALAIENDADLFISIHHNATADTSVNFPIIYYHGNASENRAGVHLAKITAEELRKGLFNNEGPAVVASDHTIFPSAGTRVLRNTYGIPGIISEASFFTHPAEEARLKDPGYNRREAGFLLSAILRFFEEEPPDIHEKNSFTELPPFGVAQEDARMNPETTQWLEFYNEARTLFEHGRRDDLEKAGDLASKSVRYFPDSPVAGKAHLLRADIFEALGEHEKARLARLRVQEFYPLIVGN